MSVLLIWANNLIHVDCVFLGPHLLRWGGSSSWLTPPLALPAWSSKPLSTSLWGPCEPNLLAEILGVPVQAGWKCLLSLQYLTLKEPNYLMAFLDIKWFKLMSLGMTHSDTHGSLLGHDSALRALPFEWFQIFFSPEYITWPLSILKVICHSVPTHRFISASWSLAPSTWCFNPGRS